MRRGVLQSWILVAACVLFHASPAGAQTLTTGGIEGIIRDATGAPVVGALVTLTTEESGRTYSLRATRLGRFSQAVLPPGRYDVLVETIGFRPELLRGVVIAPGTRRSVAIELRGAQGSVQERGESIAPPVAAAGIGSAEEWLLGGSGGILPHDLRTLASIGILSSRVGARGELDGLPASMTTLMIDGLPLAVPVTHASRRVAELAIPLSSLGVADVVTLAPDVEWPGAAGGRLAGLMLRGSHEPRVAALADYGGDSFAGADAAPFHDYRIGGRFGAPLVPDVAALRVGVELARADAPLGALWADADALAAAAAGRGLDLSQYTAERAVRAQRVTGYGRLDYRVAPAHELAVRGFFTQLPRVDSDPFDVGGSFGGAFSGRAALVGATLDSRIGDSDLNELNISFETGRTEREDAPEGLSAPAAPRTTVAADGLAFGYGGAGAADVSHRQILLRDAYILARGGHQFKIGASAIFTTHDVSPSQAGRSEFVFGNASELAAGRGYFRQESPGAAEFTTRGLVIFAQDSWSPSPGLELLAGVRLASATMPDSTTIQPSAPWSLLTGLSNRGLERTSRWVEPRFSIRWSPAGSGWTMQAGAQVEGDVVSPALLAELVGDDGAGSARAAVDVFSAYPQLPSTTSFPSQGTTLTMFGPEFRSPRSTRAGATLAGAVGPLQLMVAGALRRTEFLPKRRDLNLPEDAPMTDQHGRPVYGMLVQRGEALVAQPLGNRRFAGFDRVWGIEATGTSEYRALTLGVAHKAQELVSVFGEYTWSKTTDNWPGGWSEDPALQVSPFPFPGSEHESWIDGTSDLDVPHRLVAGATVRLPATIAPAVSVMYRRQSGYPFTPGFRPGVDANADGSADNDPAFITSGLVDGWPCLSESAGGFARRNSCRGPAVQSLDARLSVDIALAGTTARLVLDALNLVTSETGVVDRAVYLVDPAGSVQVGSNGSITIPLSPNPEFGELLIRRSPERVLRLGVRVDFR